MCAMHAEPFPNSLVVVGAESMTIGTIDEIQKLQIRKIPLGESPHRIAHQESSGTLCVLTTTESCEWLYIAISST